MKHRTLAFKKVPQLADIRFDEDSHATYINVAEIELVTPNAPVQRRAAQQTVRCNRLLARLSGYSCHLSIDPRVPLRVALIYMLE